MAWSAIAAHKLRSGLTLLGVLVGVFSIDVVMTTIKVLQHNIESEMSELGANTFRISRWPVLRVEDHSSWEKYFRRKPFRYELARRLAETATLAKNVATTVNLRMQEALSPYKTTNPDVQLIGSSPDGFETQNWIVEEGRAVQTLDEEGERLVCVLGNSLARLLFPYGSALGGVVRYDGLPYRVIGVLEAKGGLFGQTEDNFLIIPISTALNRYGKEISLSIQVQAFDQASYSDTVEQVRGILRTLRKVPPGEPDDFEIVSNDLVIDAFRSFTLAVRAGAGAISSIALLAAGVGIMNIMLVSVTERTREIGIRRAIGAKKRNILVQFILEAVVLCEIGGLLGVLLGVLGGNIAGFYLQVRPVIPLDWTAIGLGICSVVGVVFGTYPAMKAANLDPIEALRYE